MTSVDTPSAVAQPRPRWRARLHEIIFESDTAAGRAFDVALLIAIVLSVAAVVLESVADIRRQYGPVLRVVEWTLTVAFTIEYGLRLIAVDRPLRYATSFFGVVDLLSIVPTYLAVAVPETQSFMVIRAIRLLRVFRILKAAQFLSEAQVLTTALRTSRRKITVFLGGIATVILIAGTLMYVIEGEEHGYAIIAVPTGIVSVELAKASRSVSRQACPACGAEGHDVDASHCKYCGEHL